MKEGSRHIALLLLFLLVSCNLDDDRDLCCETNSVRFRYLYKSSDRFLDYITTARYFLFDGEGCYLRELQPEADALNKVSVETLASGSYTIVCIGNLADYGTLEGYTKSGLQDFFLRVSRYYDEERTAFTNGDRLYWGQCDFTISRDVKQEYVGEMSNVHCKLRVRVEWETAPDYTDGYRYHLDGIGMGIHLHDSDEADVIDVHTFPVVANYGGSMREPVSLSQSALEASLYTLRWGATEIPRFRLYHDDQPAMTEVDLAYVFGIWGWHPEQAAVQEYDIRVLIRTNGTVVVYQGVDVGVGDWINGGTIG